MERLTDKNHNAINDCGEYSSCYSCRRTICYVSQLADKLGELEDFMEMCGYDSVETMAGDIGYMKGHIESQVTEIIDLKEHTKDLNNKLLNIQLFLKNLRDSFHKSDEVYEEIDKKLKELDILEWEV